MIFRIPFFWGAGTATTYADIDFFLIAAARAFGCF